MDSATRAAIALLRARVSQISNFGTAPSGAAGGVLSGTFPSPGFAQDMATQTELNAHTGATTAAHGGIVSSADARLTDARAPTAHSHPQSDVTGLVSALAGKAASSHTHAQSEVTNLVTDLAAKANLSGGKVPTSELGSGTADNTKFLRGDQTWQVPAGGGGAAESFVSKSKWSVD